MTTELIGGDADEIDVLLPPDMPRIAAPDTDARSIELAGATMGTHWSLEALAPASVSPAALRAQIESGFELVISQMSQWQPDSQISQFNAGAPGTRHAIGAQFRQVMECALEIAEMSGMAFDPALGGVADAWGFGPSNTVSTRRFDASTQAVDWGAVLSDPGSLLQTGGVRLDLSGIAKGFAVDLGVAIIQRCGVEHALFEIGGELKGIGLRADGMPWWVDLERPDRSDREETKAGAVRVGLTGWAVATSGHWHRRRSEAGTSWGHTLDPGTGAPVGDDLHATVLHPGCMQADALATALIVLGPVKAMEFADRHRLPARLATSTGVFESAAWLRWKE